MRRKILCILMVVVIMASAVSMFACGNKGGVGNAEFVVPEGGYDGSEVTIRFYNTMGKNLQAVLNEALPRFNALYPNIKVETSQIGGYDDVKSQIATEINVGGQPNIAYCYPDHVALYNVTGAVVQLDNLIDSTIVVNRNDGSTETLGLTAEQKADFIEAYYNEGKQFGDGKMYMMPMSKSTEVLYYNKTFFDANNLSVPTNWDEMETVMRQIKAIDPTCIPLGYDSEANWFITMCEQLGSPYTSAEKGNYFLFNNETNQNFVKRFRKWHKDNLVTTEELYGAYTSGLFTAKAGSQRSYMCIGSSAGASYQAPGIDENTNDYPFEVGITGIPQVNANNPKVISQGPSLCIFGKENPQEVIASWLFVKFLTTDFAFQAKFSSVSGYIPVLKSLNIPETEEFADDDQSPRANYGRYLKSANGFEDGITAYSVKMGLAQQNAYYTSPAFNGSSMAREKVGELMAKCFVFDGDETAVNTFVNQAFADAIAECEYFTRFE